jgi:hypothetical protein
MEVEMKMVKSLLLGTAAGLVAVAGAQAADMPVKAKPVLYVKICSLYGDGFYYVPGTNTCIKIGGYLRVQVEYQSGAPGQAIGGGTELGAGRLTRVDTNDLNWLVRGLISLDVRDQTEYGTLRSYVRMGASQASPGVSGTGTTPCNVTTAGQCLFYWDRAFIQFAGFTVGRSQSFYDIFTYGGGMSYLNVRTAGDTGAAGVNMFAYTAQFGNGYAASLSAEDPNAHNKGNTLDLTQPGFLAYPPAIVSDNAFNLQGSAPGALNNGFRMPDVIFNLRVDQAWGFAGVSYAIHDVSGGYYGTPDVVNNGHPADKLGWAAAVGGQLNLQGGDGLGANFSYTVGAPGYAINVATWNIYNGSNRVAAAWGFDGIFATGTDVELTTAWSVNAGYQHIWNAKWRTSVYAGFAQITYSDTAKAMINSALPAGNFCNPGAFAGVAGNFAGWAPLAGNSCNPSYSFWQIGSRTQWNPVPLLDIGLDVFYTHVNTAYKGPVNFAAAGARPACTNTAFLGCSADDENVWSAIFRWQRNFYP